MIHCASRPLAEAVMGRMRWDSPEVQHLSAPAVLGPLDECQAWYEVCRVADKVQN